MQLKKTSKKIESLINEIRTFSNEYFSFNNIDEICFFTVSSYYLSGWLDKNLND